MEALNQIGGDFEPLSVIMKVTEEPSLIINTSVVNVSIYRYNYGGESNNDTTVNWTSRTNISDDPTYSANDPTYLAILECFLLVTVGLLATFANFLIIITLIKRNQLHYPANR